MVYCFVMFCKVFLFFFTASLLLWGKEPLDVVIPAHEKDCRTLDLCIAGIRKNCSQVRKIFVVSSHPLTDNAEWIDESFFPFNKYMISFLFTEGDPQQARSFLALPSSRIGWYFQQLLKLYAPFVIPDISSNVLILDADTVFLNPVEFIDDSGNGLYNVGTEHHLPYFVHAKKFLPGLNKLFPHHSCITHHMLFQRPILEELFALVERHHKKPLWLAFCACVAPEHIKKSISGASEYEIYMNFAFSRNKQVLIRPLKWTNVEAPFSLEEYKNQGYHYISCHSWNG